MKKILITRKLIKSSEEYAQKFFNVKLNKIDKLLTKEEIIQESVNCDGILSSITDKFDEDIILRSEEHTSELQSLVNLVCRLLLEKKNTQS